MEVIMPRQITINTLLIENNVNDILEDILIQQQFTNIQYQARVC